MKRTVLAVALFALVGAGLFWSRQWSRTDRARVGYPVTGVVVALEDNGDIRVAHRDVPGLMPAMTMPFALANPRDRERLSRGDVVQFTFLVGADRSEAVDVRVIGSDAAALQPYGAAARNFTRLRAGDAVPVFSLVDQDGAPLSERDFLGRTTVVTFIFTRCPVPEYCPRIVGRFREVQRALAQRPALAGVRLLSVTLDPAHDTPAVLGAYGRALGADFDRWRFATGEADQVSALTRAFAVHVETAGGLIDHTLATAVIDARGRVVELWRGNAWETAEVLETLDRLGPASGG